jgi:AraC-like DNA-binding protein
MNSQPNDPFLDSDHGAKRLDKFVSVYIEIDAIKAIIPFLLTHQIPFFMSSSGFPTETVPDKKDTIALEEKPIYDISKNRSGIERVFQKYISENIKKIPPNAVTIAEEAGISISRFKPLFKKQYGNSFYQYAIGKKMKYAATLLQQGFKATEVSDKLGYAHPIKFNKMFQKHFGMTPHKYRLGQQK